MDNSKNSAVVHSLTDKRMTTQAHVELDGARRLLSMPTFSWNLAVQHILGMAGLDVSEALLVDEPPTAITSSAYQLGHTSVKSLIATPAEQDGMGLDWGEFREKLTAAVYKKKYQISDNDFREVNALVEDATAILGRAPIDVGEFHSTKERALSEKISNLTREHDSRVRAMADKQQSLTRELAQRQQELDTARSDQERLSQEVLQRINDMRRETAESQERIERQADLRISQETERVSRERDVALGQLREQISGQVAEANNQRALAESELKSIQDQIANGVYVPSSVVKALEEKLTKSNMAEVELHNQLLALNAHLVQEQQDSLSLRNQLETLLTSTSGDKEQIRVLEQRLRDVVDERLNGSTEFMLLQERLNMSRSEITALIQTNDSLKATNLKLERDYSEVSGAYTNLKAQGKEYCEHLRTINREACDRNTTLIKQFGQAKLMLGVVLVTGAGAAIALTLSMTGII